LLKKNNICFKFIANIVTNSKKDITSHFIAILILSIGYLISLFFFGEIVINPHDNLEIGPVFNSIISKVYLGNFESLLILQAENFKWFYLDKILYPINIFQVFLSDKQFYFFEEFLKKIISYFSFYILSKSFTKNHFDAMIGSIIFTSLIYIVSIPHSYFIPFAPYFLYLLCNKNTLSKLTLLLIFFIGLNSSIIFDLVALILLIPLGYILRESKNNLKVYYQFIISFTFGCLISGIPIFFTIFSQELSRVDLLKPSLDIAFKDGINELFNFFKIIKIDDIFLIPIKILFIVILCTSLFLKDKVIFKLIIFFIIFYLLKIIFSSNILNPIFIEPISFLKGFNFIRFKNLFPLIICLIIVLNLKHFKLQKYKSFVLIMTVISSIFLYSNFVFVEIVKSFTKNNLTDKSLNELRSHNNNEDAYNFFKLLLDENSYKNQKFIYKFESINSFDKYYRYKEYSNIKKLIDKGITISIGIDPMIAAMNGIKVADGYYPLYSAEYKKKFEKIISKELENNISWYNYFKNWGNRVYVFFGDEKNLMINFAAAKKLKVSHVISSFKINDPLLIKICSPCIDNGQLNLYKIE
tara:strand:+ start:1547 stop:3292 length:1746 start_codon:yes stop_codon:yes gene_type:complete